MKGLELDQLLMRNLCQWASLAPSALAKRAGLAASTVLRPYNGTADTRISRATINKLRDAFPGFPGWEDNLALQPSHVPTSDRGDGEDLSPEVQEAADQLGLAMIPELVDYAFGLGGTYSDALTEVRHVPFRRDWLNRRTQGVPADVFLTPGRGDSMEPTIRSGDDILVNRAENVIRDQDEIWAVAYGQIGAIKRVRRLAGGGWQLHSDNKLVPPIDLADDELHVVGRVIWVGRGM
ncbi:MAG TPA: helix-turn-helix transcriptional regulator [Allosphingosinicella sp.]|nr:helix-turn-helix transcriptional regulator [Allosphingosinicella sp.]